MNKIKLLAGAVAVFTSLHVQAANPTSAEPYRILITNDDGILAKGLLSLVEVLSDDAEIMISAPRDKVSGRGHASDLWNGPMKIDTIVIEGSEISYGLEGTPADAVRFGIIQAEQAGKPIDLVISGINSGDNAGNGAHLSGTVGAAMEALYHDIPAIAVSLDHGAADIGDYEQAARFIDHLVTIVRSRTLPGTVMLNVNIPTNIKGVKVSPMGDYSVKVHGYRKTPEGYVADIQYPDSEAPGTDYYDFQRGYITVSPLTLDMTNYKMLEILQQWHIQEKH